MVCVSVMTLAGEAESQVAPTVVQAAALPAQYFTAYPVGVVAGVAGAAQVSTTCPLPAVALSAVGAVA